MIVYAVVDTREPQWAQELQYPNATIVASPLEYGDAMIYCKDGTILLVERKTPNDLLGSVADDRIFAQVAGMVQQTPWAYVVVTGELRVNPRTGKVVVGLRETGWDFDAIQGALLSVQELGAHVVYCAGDEQYGATLMRLSRRLRKTKPVGAVRGSRVLSRGEQAVMSLSKAIGFDRLDALIKYAGTPAAAIDFLTDLQFKGDCPGIGDGIKQDVRQNLGLDRGVRLGLLSEGS